jgi:tetratricopeptide (TPR) repeat protein
MTKTTQTVSVPAGWDKDACVHWARNERIEAVQATLKRLNAHKQADPRLALQAAYYLFLMDEFRGAATILEHQLTQLPEHFETVLNLSVCYARLNRHEDSVRLARRALEIDPDNFTALDGLAAGLHRLQRYEEAGAVGTRVLGIKDGRSDAGATEGWRLPEGSPRDFATQPGKRNVVTYSLWGDKPVYLRGALRNLLLGPDMYPGWTLRFNVDHSVPEEFIKLIRLLGGEVVMHPPGQTLRQKLCWRFQVANDPDVGYFLSRDVDSVINAREVQAVQAWTASDAWFHVMRDWWTHTDLMLAGMWGGVAGVLPDLVDMLEKYRSATAETPNIDQWFLRDRVWPYVRQSCMEHDRCFRARQSRPFPGPILASDLHVGQDEYAAHGNIQERQLYAWIKQYSCLGPLRWHR